MRDAFLRAARRSDLVLVSGGLGPTRDDRTLAVLAETFGRELRLHQPSLRAMEAFFARAGREMSPSNRKQALLPEGAEVLENPIGTAPGCMLETPEAVFFCLPGVPRELMRMMEEEVVPRILRRQGGRMKGVVRSALLRTFGMGESRLEDELSDLARDEHVSLGFRTAFPDNYLRPVARGSDVAEAEARLEALCAAIRERLGPVVYGRDEETLEEVCGRLLCAAGRTVAVAESCTGGLLGERFTAVPGSSRYFLGGVVAYANAAKCSLLGISQRLLSRHGAVSEPVARAMAEGARQRLGADLALSTTGISGPGGGTPDKPVGLVWIGLASDRGSEALEWVLPFDRLRHRLATSQLALDWLRRSLLELPPPRRDGSRRAP